MAGNQYGKTHCGGAESAMHTTGRYPEGWDGKRFTRRTRGWCCGISHEKIRDVVQRKLFGEPGHVGTGLIPQNDIETIQMSRTGGGVIDYALIRHQSGGYSWLGFRSYEQGWEKFTGDDLDWIWCDEEPDIQIYQEIQARTTTRRGIIYTTFTPERGITEVVAMFYPEPNAPFRYMVHMGLDDALHIPEARHEEERQKYPKHVQRFRVDGLPFLGSGAVFPIDESYLSEPAIAIPDHWARIAGLDLGIDHPTAVVWAALDRDNDVLHVYDAYRRSGESIPEHASAIRSRGAWIPVAWPQDAWRREQGTADPVIEIYRREGVNMLHSHSTFPEGGYGTEAGVQIMLDRMLTSRFKVVAHLNEWWDEFRNYHRKDGKLVKRGDDLMSATRQIVMMLRYAQTPVRVKFPRQVGMDWDPLSPVLAQDQPKALERLLDSRPTSPWRN